MNSLVATLITGVISYAATNIDDMFVLTLFFSQTPRKWRVVLGQYLGFTPLLVISLVGFFGGRVLPHEWVRFFGLAPIAIGVKKFLVKSDGHLKRRDAGILDVAFVTFANGDNIGIYGPLFAVSDLPRLLELIALFYCFWAYGAWSVI
jgi:cadmium resistance protein CadD (predicted permease)